MNLNVKANIAIFALASAALGMALSPYLTYHTKTVSVTSTTVKPTPDGSKYLIFTDQGVFENTDSWQYFKFNSSDVYGKLAQGGQFEISYYGWRVPFLSMYPNITYAIKKN